MCVSVNSQEDARSQEQEERVFHQVRVSICQKGQVVVAFFQFFDPALTSLEHSFELTEGAAWRGGFDTEDRREAVSAKLQPQTRSRLQSDTSEMSCIIVTITKIW